MKNESTILTFFDALQDGGGADAATAAAIEANLLTANNIWMMLATALVFIMHLGFAGVETSAMRTWKASGRRATISTVT